MPLCCCLKCTWQRERSNYLIIFRWDVPVTTQIYISIYHPIYIVISHSPTPNYGFFCLSNIHANDPFLYKLVTVLFSLRILLCCCSNLRLLFSNVHFTGQKMLYFHKVYLLVAMIALVYCYSIVLFTFSSSCQPTILGGSNSTVS